MIEQTNRTQDSLEIPLSHTMRYLNPLWHDYNVALTKIVHPSRSKGPIIATGCGHFIQIDDPQFVATAIMEILQDIRSA